MEPIGRNFKALLEDELPQIECDICEIKFSGVQPYESHLQGRKHNRMVTKLKAATKLRTLDQLYDRNDSSSADRVHPFESALGIKPYGRCDLCKKTFSGPEGQHQHLVSQAHVRKLSQSKIREDISKLSLDDKNHIFIKKDTDEDDLSQNFAECTICDKLFNNPISLTQHLESAAHQRSVREKTAEQKLKSYSVVQEDYSYSLGFKYKCKICDASFLNVTSLEKHLTSRFHNKQKHKKDIVEFLSKYPDVKQVPPANIVVQDEQSSDDQELNCYPLETQSDLFVCTICNCSFCGPESAKDHVLSKKHAKSKAFIEAQMNIIAAKKVGVELNQPVSLEERKVPSQIQVDLSKTSPHEEDDFEVVM